MTPTNVTQQLLAAGAPALRQGESYWQTEKGNLFKVYIIHDDVASKPGHEIFRMFSTYLHADGQPVYRSSGEVMFDALGHQHIMLADTDHTLAQGLSIGIGCYLSNMDTMVAHITSADALHDLGLVVKGSQATFIPDHLTHLQQPQPYNTYYPNPNPNSQRRLT